MRVTREPPASGRGHGFLRALRAAALLRLTEVRKFAAVAGRRGKSLNRRVMDN